MLNNNVKNIVRHSFIYALGWLANILASVVLLPVYSAYLSRADYGAIDLVQQMNVLLKIIFMSGLHIAVTKFYHDATDDTGRAKAISTSVMVVTALGLLASALCFLLNKQISLYVFGDGNRVTLVNVGALTLFFEVSLMGLSTQYYVSQESGSFVKLNLAKLLTGIAANLLFIVWYRMGAIGMLYGSLVSYLAPTAIAACRCLKRYGNHFDPETLKKMFRYGFPLVPATLLATVMHSSDRFLLRYYGSLDQVGLYTMGLNFPSTLNSVLLSSFNSTWAGAAMFQVAKQGDSDLQTGKIATYFMTVFCCLQAALGIFSTTLMQVLVNQKFYAAHVVIPIACLGFSFHALYTFFAVGAYTKSKTALMMYAYAVPVFFKIAASCLLIRYYGYLASAWITTATYALFALACYLLFRHLTTAIFEFGRLATVFISCSVAVMGACSLPDGSFLWRAAAQCLIFLALLAFLWLAPILDLQEREQIKTEIGRRLMRLSLTRAA